MRRQAILHASLDRSALSVNKFARWLRAICTMLLARNTAPDRLKAIGYVEQAITVLEEHGGDDVGDEVMTIWPLDQVTHSFVVLPPKRHTRWTSVIGFSRLPTTRGLNASSMALPCRPYTSFTHDLFFFSSVCLLDDARRWFEASSRLCRYVPDGEVRGKKVGHPLLSSNLILIFMWKLDH